MPAPTRAGRSDTGRRWLLLVVLVVVSLALWAWTMSYAGVPFGWAGLAVLASLATGAFALALISQHPDEHSPLLVVGVVSLAVVLGVSLVASGAPRTLRFEASRPALERLVASRPTTSLDCPGSVGMYGVAECRSIGDGYLFLQRENALTDDSGIAWLPGGPDDQRLTYNRHEFTHLDGPWYRWTCGC